MVALRCSLLVLLATPSLPFVVPQHRRRLAALEFFNFGPKKTNPDEEVTATARLILRLRSPNQKASYPLGALDLEIFEKASPMAAGTFRQLVESNSYQGRLFHRIIRGFMVQAGQGVECAPYLDDERGLALEFGEGALAMSNAGEPNTGNAEFFVTTARADELDGKYVVIGRVKETAFKVVKEIEKFGDNEGNVFNDVYVTHSELI
eukprot:CAMPEP_0118897930 /NCGR_PEP_ID=MMETSP1166-20130328/5131_1 /TAXON_ID=1104430 /ORGANISM="Chrysoreinhardia sp, Strain CCMP3193" /LENGTH=205 /DNA_ID=CAMNT_0006837009 /DNA_START=62 /DNA_END=679 /DNA_ORIENTATION=+